MYTWFRKARRAFKSELRRNYARFKRRRSKATYIAVTGSSAKTTTAALLSHILSGTAKVKTQVLDNGARNTWKTLRSVRREHDYVVCEIGTAGPGDLKPMADLIKPSVGIVTLIGLEHKSAFGNCDAVADEKRTLIEALPENGLAILNYDDSRVASMASQTKARAVTFGELGGDYIMSNVQSHIPGGTSLSIAHEGDVLDVTTRLAGAHHSVSVAAAFACAHQLGVPPSVCQERIASFTPIFGRCSVHSIENGPVFIADTNKAPYWSIYLAINMMALFSAPRKRIVVGQISDAGNTNPKYRDIYRAARDVADQVIFVGDNAHRSKATAEEISTGRFVEKRSVQEAATFIKETAVRGEIILLKSSPNLHLERLLLNFQSAVHCWEQECKKKCQCVECGLYDLPFKDHATKSKGPKQLHKRMEPVAIHEQLAPSGPS